MALNKDKKGKIIKSFQRGKNDTGSSEVQVALLSERISALTEHLKLHKKDFHSRRGLLQLVSKRRKTLVYLKRKKEKIYLDIIKKLHLKG